MTDRYHVTYAFAAHPEGMPKEKIPAGWGGTDAFLFASILRSESGDMDISLISGDGKSGERLKAGEVASIAGAVLLDCAESEDLDDELRIIFRDALEKVREFVGKRRKENSH